MASEAVSVTEQWHAKPSVGSLPLNRRQRLHLKLARLYVRWNGNQWLLAAASAAVAVACGAHSLDCYGRTFYGSINYDCRRGDMPPRLRPLLRLYSRGDKLLRRDDFVYLRSLIEDYLPACVVAFPIRCR